MKRFRKAALATMLAAPLSVQAQIPTTDVLAIAVENMELAQIIEQLREQVQQTAEMVRQYEQMRRDATNMFKPRNWLGEFSKMFEELESVFPPEYGDIFREGTGLYEDVTGIMNRRGYPSRRRAVRIFGNNQDMADIFMETTRNAVTAEEMAEASYEQAGRRTEAFIDIRDNANDSLSVRAATNLNTIAVTQVGESIAELQKLISLQLNIQARQEQREASSRAAGDRFVDDIPTEELK